MIEGIEEVAILLIDEEKISAVVLKVLIYDVLIHFFQKFHIAQKIPAMM